MSIPFRLQQTGGQGQANIGRGEGGKFVKLESPSVPDIIDKAERDSITIDQAAAELEVPITPVSSPTPVRDSAGNPTYKPSLPWPEAGPTNDSNSLPMKLR